MLVLFSLLLLAVALASAWYVAFRVRTICGWTRRWPLRLAVAFALIALLATPAVATAPGPLAGAVYGLGGFFLVSYLYLVLALIVLQAAEAIWRLPRGSIGAAALLLSLGPAAAGAFWATRFSVRETEIPLRGLDRTVVLMQISDLHLGHHRGRRYLERVVAATNQRQPDIVVITGDLLDSRAALVPDVLAPLSGFAAPVYYVGGNHEQYAGRERAFELAAQQGVHVLQNEVVEVKGLALVGLDYMNADNHTPNLHPSSDTRTIESVLAQLTIPTDRPSVLLHHSPAGAEYVAAKGVSLMLAGHTHAGQVFPMTLLTAYIHPYNRGLYRHGDLTIFVSPGAGTFMSPVRLGTSNELDLLRLTPSGDAKKNSFRNE